MINVWRLSSEKEIITPLASLPTPAVILAAARICHQKGSPCLEIWLEVRKKAAGCTTDCVQGVAGEQAPQSEPSGLSSKLVPSIPENLDTWFQLQ